jgi:SAM-dependent methyltransferase
MYEGEIALSYDALYGGKDYANESKFLIYAAETYFKSDTANLTVLDFGCGTGNHGKFLSKKFNIYIGLDKSNKMLEVAQGKIGREKNVVLVNNLSELDETQNSKFDVVLFLFSVIGHIGPINNLRVTLELLLPKLSEKSMIILDFWDKNKLSQEYGILRKKHFVFRGKEYTKVSQGEVDIQSGRVRVQTLIEEKITNRPIESQVSSVYAFSSYEIRKLFLDLGFVIALDTEDGQSGTPLIDSKSRWIIATR